MQSRVVPQVPVCLQKYCQTGRCSVWPHQSLLLLRKSLACGKRCPLRSVLRTLGQGWEGEFITLYRALVAILVFLVGPLFSFLRGVCLLIEILLAPLCCGAFGGASR